MTGPRSRFSWPPFVRVLTVIAVLGGVSALIRLVLGLGSTTNLNDGYPWGLWIAGDVVVGTALATGGYALALLVYILNRGRYHPLVRPAIVASALGYSLAGLAVALDVGRWWTVWKVPLFFWRWNLHSVLLEVALCIMAYTVVLWIEASPAFLDRAAASGPAWLRPYAARAGELLDRALLWIVAAGILLPTMHQSSLGSLMYLAGPRLHELWRTPFLPLLYLLSAIGMGYAVVLLESILSNRLYGRKPDIAMLAGLGLALVPVMGAYLLVRVGDLGLARRAGIARLAGRLQRDDLGGAGAGRRARRDDLAGTQAAPPRYADARGAADAGRRHGLPVRYLPAGLPAGRALVVLPRRARDLRHRRDLLVRSAGVHHHRPLVPRPPRRGDPVRRP